MLKILILSYLNGSAAALTAMIIGALMVARRPEAESLDRKMVVVGLLVLGVLAGILTALATAATLVIPAIQAEMMEAIRAKMTMVAMTLETPAPATLEMTGE